eukprot:3135187-Prymnesium_polylepis.1
MVAGGEASGSSGDGSGLVAGGEASGSDGDGDLRHDERREAPRVAEQRVLHRHLGHLPRHVREARHAGDLRARGPPERGQSLCIASASASAEGTRPNGSQTTEGGSSSDVGGRQLARCGGAAVRQGRTHAVADRIDVGVGRLQQVVDDDAVRAR